jgi:LPPG:FO 2-phospho-L-lactate transferase
VKVTALAGGVGGAKLLVGLDRVLPAADLTAIVNVADDAEIYGVHVSPDIDIVTYWLAGLADTELGWGIENDTFELVDALERIGGESWFRLGDRDFATCVFRTLRLREGASLTVITNEIASALGVGPRVLPATDDLLRTYVVTADGRRLDFQEYFVKERTEPTVSEVAFEGIDSAKPGPDVIDAIEGADVVVVCPSNPYLSVAPILELPGVRGALQEHGCVVAVSPIIRGTALKGPADRLLQSLGAKSSAAGVADLYRDFCNLFVVDSSDGAELAKTHEVGVRTASLDTVMVDHDASARLAGELLELVSSRGK